MSATINFLMLKRELGIIDLTMSSVTGMIGSGWLFSALYASSIAGPYSIISWIVGSLIVAVLALIYADLSGRMPTAGAAAAYPFLTNGDAAGSINAWSLFLGYASTPPLEVIASITYMNFVMPGLINSSGMLTLRGMLIAISLLFVFFIINAMGIRHTSKVNNYISYLKIGIPIITSFFFISTMFSISNFSYVSSVHPEGIFTAIPDAGIAFSFLGFRQAVELSGEAKNPQRTVPIAIMLSVAIASGIYLLVQVAFIGSLKWFSLTPGDWSGLYNSAYSSGPMLVLASALGLGALASVLLFDGVVSPLGTSNVYQTSTSRVVYRISRMGFLTKKIGTLNSNSVPFYALLLDFFVMSLFILPFPSWYDLVSVNSDLTIIAYMTGPISLVIMNQLGIAPKGFKLPLAKILAPLGFVFSILIIYWSGYPTTLYMSIIALAGLVLFIFARRSPLKSLVGASYMIFILIFVPVASFLGSYGIGLFPFPYDIAIVAVASLGAFAIGTRLYVPSADMSDRIKETVN
ncbi:amino acid transporter [Thermoplasma volcanium GSS1]|uniref:Amino acid transporter n=1 Tax=Thermoplasma volcanium (strain ATCC 51530 / DSM 4299 / JCM 9571 / NBRC 15438 / GSS1) TaxID=273116 RepID=Q978X9_THEVO|nr:APC family permease [Thermoplasma volcanium]BAB60427.1 amino acid transporter [Thermoplasma volcanium GSS1]